MLSLSRNLLLVLAAVASVSGCAQTSQPDTRSMQGGGMGRMGGGMMAPERSPGWMMMSEQERAEHRQHMMSFQSPDECRQYMWNHHQAMMDRAKAQGKTLSDLPQDACPGGMGMGMGMMGGGMGMGMMGGGGRMTPEQSPGWMMMSEPERAEHRQRMMSFQSPDECRKYMEDHHKTMLERAKAQGKTLPDLPKDACPGGMGMMMHGGDKR